MLPYSQWLVWVIPIISSLFIPVLARFGEKPRNYFAVLTGLVTTIFALSMIPDVYSGTNAWYDVTWLPTLGVSAGVMIDPLSVLLASLVSFFSVIITMYSLGYMADEEGLTRYYFFLLLFIGSMIGLVMSDNFLQMFVFWEMVGLCSYSLISFWYKRPQSVRAAVKVFLMTRIGDICLLAAIALLYTSLGSLSFSYTISHIGTVPMQTTTAIAFLTLGAAIAKSAQLPLHTWLYSAMEAPTSISALLHSATMVKAGIYLVARMFILFGLIVPLIPLWLPTITWIGAITAIMAATLALRSNDIKGVPAYSTISQIGFMMAALGTATSASSQAWFASLFHLVSHAFFQGLGFMAIGGIVHAVGTRDMTLMGGLRKQMPVTFWLCIIMMLTAAGVPPFASFFSKELILSSVGSTGNVLLEIILYASTAATFAYTLRFMILVFMRGESDHVKEAHPHDPPKTMLFSSGILAALCIVWGLAVSPIAGFMRVDFTGISEFFGPSILLLFAVLCIGGLPVYFAYYRRPASMDFLAGYLGNSIGKVLDHGYFFDNFYEMIIVKGIGKVSQSLEYVEKKVLLPLPSLVGVRVLMVASATHRYFDVFVDELMYLAAHKTLISVSKLDRRGPEYLSHYIASALFGFLVLSLVVLVTMLR